MRQIEKSLPLLPLVLDAVPEGLGEMLVQEGVPFCDRAKRPLAGRFVLFDSRRKTRESSFGQTWIDVAGLGQSTSGEGLNSLADGGAGRHEWRVGGWTLTEEIARVDRRAVRRRVLGRLREAIEAAGGVWLCVSPYPFPYRSAFNFRFDHDEYDARDFAAVMRAIRGYETWTSHFVNAAGHKSAGSAWDALRGLDVGSHGYWHHTYRTIEDNARNILRGIEAIRRMGIEPRGFAAPHGRFGPALDTALRVLEISHSGEFGLAYDELPFCPSPGGTLQVPVHPVCLGLFLEAAQRESHDPRSTLEARRRHAAATAAEYFEKLISQRCRAGEPVFLYGHPDGRLGRYPGVLKRVFRAADSQAGLWKTTQSGWVEWWHARRALNLKVTEDQGQYVVTANDCPANLDFAIEYWRGRHVALMPLAGPEVRFSPAALAYENRRASRLARPVRIDRPEGLKTHLRRAIDWERVTPLDEIGTSGWRNRVKRTLRKWVSE
ncbi:MAG TPA: hypothetical protein VJL29_13420 [Thermoguttaceae bacterium]|nr:hypothetical protein [Thermoguttaceae bacterium]